jgi:hypothetical protein
MTHRVHIVILNIILVFVLRVQRQPLQNLAAWLHRILMPRELLLGRFDPSGCRRQHG